MPLRLFRSLSRRSEAQTASTDGRTIYAVGDIHGRLDLLEPLLEQIRQDALAAESAGRPVLIFVGDYVDRGAASKGVVDVLISLGCDQRFEVRALKGNHEEALLAFLQDPDFGPTWCDHGGTQTLVSYGVSPPSLRMDTEQWGKTREAFAAALPDDHLKFFDGLELTAVYGDYVFVHAGLRPGVALSDQREHDLLWIRDEFLSARRPFEKIVVHGHTPAEEAFMGPFRIGIDTGAYATGVLTAVRLHNEERQFMQATARDRR